MHLIAFFFVLVSISCGQALNIRQIDRVVDVSQNSQVQPAEWYRGESVQFNAYLWRFNDQLVLPSTAQPILKAWRTNDLNTLYINVTGTLINAGQGEVRVTLTPAQANLPSGAYSFAYQIWDGTNYMGIGAQGQLRVIWSPAGDSIAYVGSSTINDFIPKPTNVWSNGWILASSTGGTTTFARAEQSTTQLVAKAGSTMSGDLDWTNSGLTSLDFATFDAAPAGAIAARRIQWNDSRSTLKLGLNSAVNLDVGQQLFLYGKNQETNTLAKGEVVFIFGASGDNPTIKRASHTSESLSARTIGIMAESATSNNNGLVVTRGTIYNVDTSTFTQGAPLYLGANGTMQTNLPDAPLHGVFIGVVERVGVNNGQIYVAVQNYQELRELSDVFVNGLANGNLLSYNSSSSRWENKTISALGLATGTPIYSVAGLATGTPIYSVAGLATGTPIYSVAGLATGTPIYSVAGLATGTPIYSVAGLATGTPIYSVVGLATGTPIYAESDPVWNAQKAGYATGTPIYTVAGLATGTPIYSIAGLATGTPVYTESDPVWAGVSNSIRLGINAAQTTGSLAYALAAAAATGSPVYVELDPVWAGVSNSIRAGINSAQTTGSLAYALAAAAATGTPIYSVAGLATGTPIYSIAGLATGTPIYAESDPVWNAQKSGYATGTPIYTVAGLATGTPIYSIAGLATGTPVYEVTQTGQVNTISLTQAVNGAITFRGSSVTQTGSIFNFSVGAGTITNLRSGSSRLIITNGAGPEVSFGLNVSGLATGTPVYEVALPNLASISNTINGLSSIIETTNIVSGVLSSGVRTGINNSAYGNMLSGTLEGQASIGANSYGNMILGDIDGNPDVTVIMESGVRGSIQRGLFAGNYVTNLIGSTTYGAEQAGYFANITTPNAIGTINSGANGASQKGTFASQVTIGANAVGAQQYGKILTGSATNNAIGAIQLFNLSGQHALTLSSAHGSILLGPGTNSVAYSVMAAGGFYGDGANITNVNARQLGGALASAYLTVSSFQNTSTNYARFITTTVAPTGSTASGLNGELRVDATNIYMYIGSSNKWMRIPGTFSW